MKGLQKEDIKNVSKEGEVVTVKFEKEIEISVMKLKMQWQILKEREDGLAKEKKKLQEIAKQANIQLE